MNLKGKVVKVLEAKTGEGKNGTWTKQEYVIETGGDYPKQICFEVWNDKFQCSMGEDVNVSIDIESREYNGNYYTNVKAWAKNESESKAVHGNDNADDLGNDNNSLPF